MIRSERGMALVVVLMAVAVLMALTTEFLYEVQVGTDSLDNWVELRQLGQAAGTGAAVAASLVRLNVPNATYTYPGEIVYPAYDPFGDGVSVLFTVSDETGRLNLNKLVAQNDDPDARWFPAFERLLEELEVDKSVAEAVVDYIDTNRYGPYENTARNAPLASVDELRSVAGVTSAVYNTLAPYVTIYGDGRVNINAAAEPVIMALGGAIDAEIDAEMAERVVDFREQVGGFTGQVDRTIMDVSGFKTIGIQLSGVVIAYKGSAFRVEAEASDGDGLKRVLTTVLDAQGTVLYWREY
jgi:general secretion pathway protein K